jgi:hypothetical protein
MIFPTSDLSMSGTYIVDIYDDWIFSMGSLHKRNPKAY